MQQVGRSVCPPLNGPKLNLHTLNLETLRRAGSELVCCGEAREAVSFDLLHFNIRLEISFPACVAIANLDNNRPSCRVESRLPIHLRDETDIENTYPKVAPFPGKGSEPPHAHGELQGNVPHPVLHPSLFRLSTLSMHFK